MIFKPAKLRGYCRGGWAVKQLPRRELQQRDEIVIVIVPKAAAEDAQWRFLYFKDQVMPVPAGGLQVVSHANNRVYSRRGCRLVRSMHRPLT